MENNKTKSSAIQKILKCGIISWVGNNCPLGNRIFEI